MSDREGLTGNSGFTAAGHLNAPYAGQDGEVFVEVEVSDGDGGYLPHCERMPWAKAQAERWPVVLCSKCERPATHLDHLAPYETEFNLCDPCWEKRWPK